MGSAAKCNTLRFHSGKRCSKIIHQCSKIIRSKSRHLKLRMRKSSSSKDLGKIQNLFRFGTVLALYIDIRKRELKMRKFTSYSPIGSDDGYDYQKDNRYGEVDDYVKFVEQWRKDQAKKKAESPNNGG